MTGVGADLETGDEHTDTHGGNTSCFYFVEKAVTEASQYFLHIFLLFLFYSVSIQNSAEMYNTASRIWGSGVFQLGSFLMKDAVRGITIVRSKELSEASRKKIVDAYESGNGYKKISKEFVISHSIFQKIIYKWSTFKTTANMARSGRPSKLTPRADRKMIKDVSKNLKISSRDLQQA
ncbi:hypothetical protein QTP86_021546 [Hemibagrus guttatus]|nr:hypothetical protein QTP86_021546 [Hemibagrus guttatus]